MDNLPIPTQGSDNRIEELRVRLRQLIGDMVKKAELHHREPNEVFTTNRAGERDPEGYELSTEQEETLRNYVESFLKDEEEEYVSYPTLQSAPKLKKRKTKKLPDSDSGTISMRPNK